MRNISRRDAIKSILAGGAMVSAAPLVSAGNLFGNPSAASEPLKGNIHHSVSKWCFGDIPLDEFCEICKRIGIESVELLDPVDCPTVKKH